MKYLVVGLGNIGSDYDHTRHNIGFMILDQFAEKHGVSFSADKLGSKAEVKFKGRTIVLIKPSTYMNLSGKSVRYWLTQLKLKKENLLVVVDDLSLALGRQRMRAKGSAAGHNGLKNIEELLGGTDYPRLKIGIGDAFSKGKQVDYVLGRFSSEEDKELPFVLNNAQEAIESFCTIGLQRAMNNCNK